MSSILASSRVIMPQQQDVDTLVADINDQSRWTIRRVREYVDGRTPGPKPDGYRAVHVVVIKDDCFVEIQLRTPFQDVWAQSVEQDTRRLRAGLKFGSGPTDLREYYVMASEFFAFRERDEEPSQEFLADLSTKFEGARRYFPPEQRQD
jgi:ppGpp synthetase/RelA/SpoT-type nucleotidyltranferase